MKDETQELPSWQNHDNSPLPNLLRYDLWLPDVAIPLLCNIDPDRSERFSAWSYFELSQFACPLELRHYDYPEDWERALKNWSPEESWMSRGYPEYWRMRLLSDDPENCPRCWYESLVGISDKCSQWRDELSDLFPPSFENIDGDLPPFGEHKSSVEIDISHQLQSFSRSDIAEHIAAQRNLRLAWEIYFSNPRHGIEPYSEIADEDDFERMIGRPPSYFIDWAETKRIEICWLDWAKARGYLLKETKAETQSDSDTPQRLTLSDARREEGLNAAIRILRHKYESDDLRNMDDFERYMKKDFVIKYIRKHSEDFPRCAKIKPFLERLPLKDREPTLTKDFPDFTKNKNIVEEYERLISSK